MPDGHDGPPGGVVNTGPAAPLIAAIDVCVERRHVCVEMASTSNGRGASNDFHVVARASNLSR